MKKTFLDKAKLTGIWTAEVRNAKTGQLVKKQVTKNSYVTSRLIRLIYYDDDVWDR